MKKSEGSTLKALANITGSRLIGDPSYKIFGFADLSRATEREISFLSSSRYLNTSYLKAMRSSMAGAIFVSPNTPLPEGKNFLVNDNPSLAFQKAIEYLYGDQEISTAFTGVAESAVVYPGTSIGANVTIGPNAVVDIDVVIGANTFIGAGSYIGPNCSIGDNCEIAPNVTLDRNCQIGNSVIIKPGAVIGGCGFGFATNENGAHHKLKHIGKIVIEDNVEIGANATIDRARFGTTRIGKGSKIDNLVVIAHNVEIGKDNILCGQTGVAGSTKTGDNVVMGGQVGVNGHIKISDNVIVAAKSGISKSINKPGKYSGIPAQPLDKYNRNSVFLRKIESYIKELNNLKARTEN